MRPLLLAICAFIILVRPALADTQGAAANRSGQHFESQIARLLEDHGYDIQTHGDYGGSRNEIDLRPTDKLLALRQPPYTTLFGSPGRCDFVLVGKTRAEDVWIETKRMSVAGSLDEKIPHMFLNALTAIPGHHVIILIDGDGWRDGALAWLHAQTKDRRWMQFSNYPNKRIDVMTEPEFADWLSQPDHAF